MSLSKVYVLSRLNAAKRGKERNDNNCSKSHEGSLIYQQDITNNAVIINKISNSITNLKHRIVTVISDASSCVTNNGFPKTVGKLQSLNSSISTEEVTNLQKKIIDASRSSHSELLESYNNLYKDFNTKVKAIEAILNNYNTLEQRLANIDRQISSVGATGDAAEKQATLNSLNSERNSVKNQMEAALKSSNAMIETLEKINTQGNELLEKGLRKA